MTFPLALAFLVITLSLIVIASRFGFFDRLRERWRREMEDPESQEALGQLRALVRNKALSYTLGTVLLGMLKAAWRWRHAPDGSPQKLVWNIVLLLAIAVGAWLALGLLDRMMNRSGSAPPDYSTIDTESERESYTED